MVSSFRLKLIENSVKSAVSMVTKMVDKLDKSISEYEKARIELSNEIDRLADAHTNVTNKLGETRKVAENFRNLLK